MAEIVLAYSASHAPMMSADKESAPPDQAARFFGGLDKVKAELNAKCCWACSTTPISHTKSPGPP